METTSGFFECVDCCFGSLNDGLLFVSFMLERFLGLALPAKVVLFAFLGILLDFGSWM